MLASFKELHDNTYLSKKMICPMGYKYEKSIHVIEIVYLYHVDYMDFDACPVYIASWYKYKMVKEKVENSEPQKKPPMKP